MKFQWVLLPAEIQLVAVKHEHWTQDNVYCFRHTATNMVIFAKSIAGFLVWAKEFMGLTLCGSNCYKVLRGEQLSGTTKGFTISKFPEGPVPEDLQKLWRAASARFIVYINPDCWAMRQLEPDQLSSEPLKEDLVYSQLRSKLSYPQDSEVQSE